MQLDRVHRDLRRPRRERDQPLGPGYDDVPSLFDTFVDGGAGADSITVGSALERNYIHGRRGNHTLTSGGGFDIVAFVGSANADVVTATETQVTAGFETDTIADIDSFDLFGREGNDTLAAQFGELNFLFGEEGNDDLTGAAETDVLRP